MVANDQWSHTFDFTTEPANWMQALWWDGTPNPSYSTGVGWTSNSNSGTRGNYVMYDFGALQELTHVKFHYSATTPLTSAGIAGFNNPSGAPVFDSRTSASLGTNQIYEADINVSFRYLQIDVGNCAGCVPAGSSIITDCEVHGIGINPLLKHMGPVDCPFCYAAVE